jgi:hypothetical protein
MFQTNINPFLEGHFWRAKTVQLLVVVLRPSPSNLSMDQQYYVNACEGVVVSRSTCILPL